MYSRSRSRIRKSQYAISSLSRQFLISTSTSSYDIANDTFFCIVILLLSFRNDFVCVVVFMQVTREREDILI